MFGLLALAALVAGLVSYDSARSAGRVSWLPGLLGAAAGLLHPWHGELFVLVVIGGELLSGRTGEPLRRRLRLPVLTIVMAGIPLVYYVLLGRADLSWKLAREASRHTFALWSIAIVIVPLLVPALLAYRRRPTSFLQAATRAWPIAAFVVFILSATALSATPLHAFQGITVPLAVLAVQGVRSIDWGRLRHPGWTAAIAVAVVTVPATVFELVNAVETVAPSPTNSTFISRDEKRAIDYLAHNREPGGVLTRSYLGAIVPGRTGRHTFVGDCLWSEPGCYTRVGVAQNLFEGSLERTAAQAFVQQTGARFVLADCSSTADLQQTLGSMIVGVQRFGCATVYELDQPGPATGPLAESRADAAVRATRRQ